MHMTAIASITGRKSTLWNLMEFKASSFGMAPQALVYYFVLRVAYEECRGVITQQRDMCLRGSEDVV